MEYITIVTNLRESTCGILRQEKNERPTLIAYEHIPATHGFAGTSLHQLTDWIKTHARPHSFALCALQSPSVHESFIRHPHATISDAECTIPALRKMVWDYRYLHALEDHYHLFYRCGIPSWTLFETELLCAHAGTPSRAITSAYMALLQAYKALYGKAFRRSQLAQDMMRSNYQLEARITPSNISRLVHIAPRLSLDVEREKMSVLSMIGLWYMQGT